MAKELNSRVRCGIVLAGGEGKRLHSLIYRLRGEIIPKQYVNFIGRRSMLEHTFDRAEMLVPPSRLLTVVNRDHLQIGDVRKQISNRPSGTVILQPENKETGPGVMLPLIYLMKRHPGSVVAVFPSDHFVLEEDIFMDNVNLACRAVEHDPSLLILLGVQPHRPDPEYGYILPNRKSGERSSTIRKVLGFIEKPPPSVSEDVVRQGGLWNTMVMVFQAETLFKLVQKVVPALHQFFHEILNAIGTPSETDVVENTYRQMEPMNFSKLFLEKLSLEHSQHLRVLPVRDVYWSDWGTEERVSNVLQEKNYASRLRSASKKIIPWAETGKNQKVGIYK